MKSEYLPITHYLAKDSNNKDVEVVGVPMFPESSKVEVNGKMGWVDKNNNFWPEEVVAKMHDSQKTLPGKKLL